MTEVSKEAVEALVKAMSNVDETIELDLIDATAVAFELKKQGFTIARAEPSAETEGIRHSAVADYLLDHKGLRPAMTDAELESKMKELSWVASTDWGPGPDVIELEDAIELAKKYRGK